MWTRLVAMPVLLLACSRPLRSIPRAKGRCLVFGIVLTWKTLHLVDFMCNALWVFKSPIELFVVELFVVTAILCLRNWWVRC